MRHLVRNISVIAVAALALSLLSCSDDEGISEYDERTAFEAFLTSQGVAEGDYGESNGVFTVVKENLVDKGETGWERPPGYDGDFPPVIASGDKVAFYFTIYYFNINVTTTASTGVIGGFLFTNIQGIIDAVNDTEGQTAVNGFYPHLDSEYWPTVPLTATIGDGAVLKGMEEALLGCRLGDSLWALIPSRMAYGGMESQYIPDNTALYVEMVVVDVNDIFYQEP